MGRIAFFVSGWTLSTFIMQLAEALADQGVQVDIICDKQHFPMIDMERMSAKPSLRVIAHNAVFSPPHTREACKLFMREACNEIFRFSQGHTYGAVVGIEKVGGALAFLAAKEWRVPLVYWSLELYNMQHEGWKKNIICPEVWLEMENYVYKAARMVIIQDEDRAGILSEMMGGKTSFLYLPVTIGAQEVIRQNSHYLHDICGLPSTRKLLLQFGNNRMEWEWILRVTQSLPDTWTFVLHGLHLQVEKAMLRHPQLVISAERCSEKKLPALVASASAGLVHYEKHHINDVLTAHSSEKLARYLAAGVPVIAHDVGNYAATFARNGAGITYTKPEQVGMAVRLFERKPNIFRQAAVRAGEGYVFENVGNHAVQYLCDLAFG